MIENSEIVAIELAYDRQVSYVKRLRSSGKMHHGYAFVGVEGGGQVLLAQQWVMAALCQKEAEIACYDCLDCTQCTQGIHPQFFHVEGTAADPIGVDDSRAIQKHLYKTVEVGQKQVVLISGAEWMSTQAANALLKISEEPPVGALFLLTTGQVSCISSTLLSRFQRVRVPYVSHKKMQEVIQNIRPDVDRHYRESIVHLADGRLGRLLEYADGRMQKREKMVEDAMFWTDFFQAQLPVRQKMLKERFQPQSKDSTFLHSLPEMLMTLQVVLHDMMLIDFSAGSTGRVFYMHKEILEDLAEQLSRKKILHLSQVIHRLRKMCDHNVNKKLILDYLIVRL